MLTSRVAKDGVIDDTLTSAPASVIPGMDNAFNEKRASVHLKAVQDHYDLHQHVMPTEEELATLPRIAGTMPVSKHSDNRTLPILDCFMGKHACFQDISFGIIVCLLVVQSLLSKS
jgi:hypothetical protein